MRRPCANAAGALVCTLVLALLSICPVGLQAAEEPADEKIEAATKKKYQLDIAAGAGKFFGYHRLIVSNINNQLQACRIASEIVFPANTFSVYGLAGLSIREKYYLQLRVDASVGPLYGYCEDSDWQPIRKHRGLMWSYSTSSPSLLNGIRPDLGILATAYEKSVYRLKLGAGFLYEHYYYRASNLQQVQLDPFFRSTRVYRSIQLNRVMTYDLNFFNIYFELVNQVSLLKNSLVLDLGFKWAPYTISYDIDNHILRAIRFYGHSYYGTTIVPLVRVKYVFGNRFFLTLEASYQYTRTWCVMKSQYYYGTIYSTQIANDMYINYLFSGSLSSFGPQILESSQCAVKAGAGMRFEF